MTAQKKRLTREDRILKKREAKKLRFLAAKARGDVAGQSRYAEKIARKMSGGAIDPRWMWWCVSSLGGES